MLSLKIFNADDIRRVSIPHNITFGFLVDRIKKMYPDLTNEFVVRYRDEDADLISITSDEELTEAIRLAKVAQNVLRIWIVPKKSEQSAVSDPTRGCGAFHHPQQQQQQQQGGWRGRHWWHQRREAANNAGCCPARRGPGGPWWQRLQNGITTNAEGKDVHAHVVCDGCEAFPIVGKRFKCLDCPDFDLCETCYDKKLHSHHNFLQIGNRKQQQPQAVPAAQEPQQEKPVASASSSSSSEAVSAPAVSPVPVSAPVPEPVPEPVHVAPAAPAPAPAPSAPAVEPVQPSAANKFEQMLQTLADMGFSNRDVNIATLVRFRGNVAAAIQHLLNQQE